MSIAAQAMTGTVIVIALVLIYVGVRMIYSGVRLTLERHYRRYDDLGR